MNAITFTVELLQPMLATGLEGDPNAGVSMPYIAGSVLRGAVISRFLNNTQPDLAFAERDLFFNEKVCFLNAYPLVEIFEAPKRSLPTLLSWHKVKDEEEEKNNNFYDFSNITPEKVNEELNRNKSDDEKDNKQFKGLTTRFIAFIDATGSNVIKAELKKRISVHTRRNAVKGRATDEEGGVFRYESIEAGTKFSGAIISDDFNLLGKIKSLIENAGISIGGSRTGGYGRAKVTVDANINTDWKETSRWTTEGITPGEFTITLLSNALVRDANGQLHSELTAEALGLSDTDVELRKNKTHKSIELVGGFNRKWGLPLPQQVSIKAGSVFAFSAKQKIEKSRIEEWLNKGIGERRLDGFGRIAVNLNAQSKLTFEEQDKRKLSATALVSANGVKDGQIIFNRVFKNRLKAEVIGLVGDLTIIRPPKNSQISRLRLFIREILRSEGVTIEQARTKFKDGFFKELKKTAGDQFASARVKDSQDTNKGNLEKWICDSVLSNTALFSSEVVTLGNDAKKVASKNELLDLEFRLKLIDGALERAAKENRNEQK